MAGIEKHPDLDPSVTDEDIERAFDGDPDSFPDAELQDQVDDEEDQPLGLTAIVPAGKAERIANAKRLRDNHTFVGVGMCLATVRGPILQIPALYPTAAVAGDHSRPFHGGIAAGSTQVPRAAIGFAWNGRAGHVWLELGGVTVGGREEALVSTTDFHENGYEGVALRSRMLSWCGATRWGWGESCEGYDVWPDPKKPTPKPVEPWTLERRRQFIHRQLVDAREAGHQELAHQLKLWQDRIDHKLSQR